MINKKSLWFLTLFSLILVLSVYYITMPSELILKANTEIENKESEPTISISEADMLVALRIEADEEMNKEIDSLQSVLTNIKSTTKEKNEAYEKIKKLNDGRSEEERLEEQIKKEYNINSFVKIIGDKINVTIVTDKHDEKLANNLMRLVQSNYDDYKYITIKIQK